MLTDESVLVPPGRLAALLSSRRKALGLDIAQMASRSGGRFSSIMLSDLERGRLTLADDSLRELTALYELEAGPVVPARSRLIVDLGGGEMRVGATGVAIEGDELDNVLERYLSLLYLLRNLKPGTPLTLRDPDVEALSEALERSIAEVEQRLGTLMLGASVETRSRLLSKRLMVPGAGLLVGVTAVGALVIVGGSAADAGKLSTPSLSSAAVSTQVDDSVSGFRGDVAPIQVKDSSAGPGARLILPSGAIAEVVDRSDVRGSEPAPSAAGLETAAAVADVEEADAPSPARPDLSALVEADVEPDESAVSESAANAVEVGPPAAVEAAEVSAAEVSDAEVSAAEVSDAEVEAAEIDAEIDVEATEPANSIADAPVDPEPVADQSNDDVEAAASFEAVVAANAIDDVEVETEATFVPPIAPVQVPEIVIPQATDETSIRVVVPDDPAPEAPAAQVELADAIQVEAEPAAGDSQFVVESSALSGPSFIINEAPDDDLVPPGHAPVEIAEAPLIVTPSGPYAQLGAEAEALISYDFRSHLPGWTIRYEGDTPGYRGLTNLPTKTISIYVNSGDTAWDIAEILGHEVGHALDVTYLTDDDRRAWLDARNMPAAWWPGDGLSDFHVGAGDWAEGVAAYLVGSPSYSAYGGFTPAQLQLVGELLPH